MQSIATPTKDENNTNDQTTTTTTTLSSLTSNRDVERNSFELNLKVIGILIGCILLIFGITRLFLTLYNSSRLSRRRTSAIQPQVATIELNQFKPDMPPAYAEAMANIDTDDTKLPSYDELRRPNARDI